MSIIFDKIRRVIREVCLSADALDLKDIVELEWNDRRIGRTIEVDFTANPKRAVFSISKPLFLNSSNEDQIIACATCHLISWAHFRRQAIAPGLDTLYGYFEPPKSLDWKALLGSYKDIAQRTCDLLNVRDLPEKIQLDWNGRLTRSAGSASWDADLDQGRIELGKKTWLQMIEDEQVEALVHGICLLAELRNPELSEQLTTTGDEWRGASPLLRRCGYNQTQSAKQIFPSPNETARPIGKPLRLVA